MKMNLKLLMVAAAAFVTLALAAGQVVANQKWDVNSGCGSGHRISHSQASCLNAGWNNSPGFWSGNPGGCDYWLTGKCASYGLVYANVDLKDRLDHKWKLTNNSRNSNSGAMIIGKVRDIACCINHGDQLCYKNQIEKTSSGQIRHVTVTGSGYSSTMVNVNTHKKRYIFCRDNPDYIYCEVNPEGDAFTTPRNCGDHTCTVGDCTWHWNRSTADATCHEDFNPYSMSISAEDGTSQTCTIQVKCESHIEPAISGGGGYMIYELNELSAPVWDFDNLANCSGTLQVGAC
jgi:hypothetical protein